MSLRLAMAISLGACAGGGSAPAPPAPAPQERPPAPVVATAPTLPDAAPAPPDAALPAPTRAATVELTFAGDVMFGRFVGRTFAAIRAEARDPFADVAPLLDSDLAMVNLETPVMTSPPTKSPYGTNMRFVTTPARLARLVGANIDAVTIANNHWYDMKAEGAGETPARIAEVGLRHVGATRAPGTPRFFPEVLDVAGWRVAFVAATSVNNTAARPTEPEPPIAEEGQLRALLLPAIAAARSSADLVVVTVHWGTEYQDEPDPWRVAAARAWIDAGADLVIGHHPHVLQGIERYGRGLIAYSLGNFLFDNTSAIKRDTGVLRVRFAGGPSGPCLASARFHPATIIHDGMYRPVPAAQAGSVARVTGRITKLSRTRPLATTWAPDGDDLIAAGACEGPS